MTIKIEEYKNNKGLAEIYQSSSSVYAFINKVAKDQYVQCTQFVKCRDFLNDAVRGMLLKKNVSIYGFSYNPKTEPTLDMNNIRLVIKDDNKNIEDSFKKAKVILNYYETLMNVDEKTSYEIVNKNIGIVVGPKVWLSSPTLTSLYSLMFRVCEYAFEIDEVSNLTNIYDNLLKVHAKNLNNQSHRDLSYLNSIYKRLEFFLVNYKTVLNIDGNSYDHMLTDNMELNSFHNYGGIVSFMSEDSTYMDKARKTKFHKDFVNKNIENLAVKEVTNLITIHSNAPFGTYDGYTPHRMYFTFVNTFGNKRTMCHGFTGCREFLIASFRALYSENSKAKFFLHGTKDGEKSAVFPVDTKKLRLLVTIPGIKNSEPRMQYHKQELFFAKKVLNYYEKLAGFKTSVISTVNVTDRLDKSCFGWLFTAGADWLKSPILLSLYPLIIRGAKHYAADLLKTGKELPTQINAENIVNFWKSVKASDLSSNADSILYDNHATIVKLLKYSNDIFTTQPEEAFFTKNEHAVSKALKVGDHNYTVYMGINSFLKGTFINKKFVNSTNKLMENLA